MDTRSHKVAQYLLNANAVKLSPENPFTWASGLRSPIYCDNRKILSYPEFRTSIKNYLAEKAMNVYSEVEVIAGVATAGIPHGVLLADALGLPFIYVRSKPKGHGLQSKIEGNVEAGKKVIVVEDLVSTGKSCLEAVESLREAGLKTLGVLALFSYQLDIAGSNFDNAKCRLETLTDYGTLIDVALAGELISQEDMPTLLEWRKNPQRWSKSNQ